MHTHRSTVRDLRRRNRSILLSKLFHDGPLSRLELSRSTGLSAATASNVTAELMEERLVVEAGLVDSDGGRPRVLLRVDPGYGHTIGIDVGETGLKIELFDLAMTRLATVNQPLPASQPDPAAVADQAAAGIADATAAAAVTPDSVIGVGVGVPGTVEQGSAATVYAPTIGWHGVDLDQLLRERGVTVPLFFDNGAKAQGQAEMWFGAGRDARYAVVALVGTGVGAALVTDGTTYQGVGSGAGEWGHTTIAYGGRTCRCGARGCLEAYVGADAVLERYREAGGTATGIDDVVRAAAGASGGADSSATPGSSLEAGSPAAAAILDETAGYLGAGIANLINLFNPERVILGGWAGLALGVPMLPRIRQAAQEHALDRLYRQTSIELCQLGPDAVAFGAATLPVAALLAAGADPRSHPTPSATRP